MFYRDLYTIHSYPKLSMADIYLSGVGDDEKAAIKQAANKANMDLATFARHRLRAGYRLWDADENFDVEKFQERVGEKEPETINTNTAQPKSVNASKEDRFAQEIKRNLPTDSEDAVSKDELVGIVSKEVINDVLSDLKDAGEVEYVIEHDGFVRAE